MDKTELKGQATPEQIVEWKKAHGDVRAVTVDGHIGYLKKPDRKTISYASSIGTKDPVKFNELILANCWLGGSEEIKTDDALFFGVSAVLGELIEAKSAELVKL